jgi:hypothetical protein
MELTVTLNLFSTAESPTSVNSSLNTAKLQVNKKVSLYFNKWTWLITAMSTINGSNATSSQQELY